jgi:hypothetical protein
MKMVVLLGCPCPPGRNWHPAVLTLVGQSPVAQPHVPQDLAHMDFIHLEFLSHSDARPLSSAQKQQ